MPARAPAAMPCQVSGRLRSRGHGRLRGWVLQCMVGVLVRVCCVVLGVCASVLRKVHACCHAPSLLRWVRPVTWPTGVLTVALRVRGCKSGGCVVSQPTEVWRPAILPCRVRRSPRPPGPWRPVARLPRGGQATGVRCAVHQQHDPKPSVATHFRAPHYSFAALCH